LAETCTVGLKMAYRLLAEVDCQPKLRWYMKPKTKPKPKTKVARNREPKQYSEERKLIRTQ